MNARELIYEHFLKPFENKNGNNIGVELEFPLLNLKKESVDVNFAQGVLNHFLNKGFSIDIKDDNDNPIFIINKNKDTLSFDNSYNNFEFSLNYSDNLMELKDRFYSLLSDVEDYFLSGGYTLAGLGTNPYKKYIQSSKVNYATYKMIDKFLNSFAGEHKYNDFPAYLSSVQTHLDVPLEKLAQTYTLFARLDFVRGLMFSNSLAFDGEKYLCYRDYLWEKSGFKNCRNITGKIDETFSSNDDLIELFAKKDMFNRIRNGEYEIFKPVNIVEYFENPKYNAQKEDINQYLSFKNVEITSRGTLEVRGDCAQPFTDAFIPPAFNLGIVNNLEAAKRRLDAFFEESKITLSNTQLRNMAILDREIADEELIYSLLYDLVEIAWSALKERGYGEEKLLDALYDRVARLSNPAKDSLDRDIDEVIEEYSAF